MKLLKHISKNAAYICLFGYLIKANENSQVMYLFDFRG